LGGIKVQLHAFLTSALDGGEWSASHQSKCNSTGIFVYIPSTGPVTSETKYTNGHIWPSYYEFTLCNSWKDRMKNTYHWRGALSGSESSTFVDYNTDIVLLTRVLEKSVAILWLQKFQLPHSHANNPKCGPIRTCNTIFRYTETEFLVMKLI